VHVAGEELPRRYRGVVIASGHHDVPRMPAYPGNFSGQILHARNYRSARQLRDKRVLVVGCGNSAADIVSDAVHGGCEAMLSIRRGYWFVPKFILGFPTGDVIDTVEMLRLPRLLKRWLFQGALWLLQGPPSRYRMPDPDYAIDQAHPTMRDEIPRLAAHGSLTVREDIAGDDGERVLFKDGSSAAVDLIVFATGYHPVVPFSERDILFADDGRSRFVLKVFHPEKDGPRRMAREGWTVRGGAGAGERQHVAACRLSGAADWQRHPGAAGRPGARRKAAAPACQRRSRGAAARFRRFRAAPPGGALLRRPPRANPTFSTGGL
jgi:hypothetical protein